MSSARMSTQDERWRYRRNRIGGWMEDDAVADAELRSRSGPGHVRTDSVGGSQEPEHGTAGRIPVDLFRRSDLRYAAGFHDGDPVGESESLR